MNITITFGRITKDGVQVLAEKSWNTKEEPGSESETAHTDADLSANPNQKA